MRHGERGRQLQASATRSTMHGPVGGVRCHIFRRYTAATYRRGNALPSQRQHSTSS